MYLLGLGPHVAAVSKNKIMGCEFCSSASSPLCFICFTIFLEAAHVYMDQLDQCSSMERQLLTILKHQQSIN